MENLYIKKTYTPNMTILKSNKEEKLTKNYINVVINYSNLLIFVQFIKYLSQCI